MAKTEKNIRHTWKDDTCSVCGIQRQMGTRKTLMAISGGKDYYQYETRYMYFLPEKPYYGFHVWERPNCKRVISKNE